MTEDDWDSFFKDVAEESVVISAQLFLLPGVLQSVSTTYCALL